MSCCGLTETNNADDYCHFLFVQFFSIFSANHLLPHSPAIQTECRRLVCEGFTSFHTVWVENYDLLKNQRNNKQKYKKKTPQTHTQKNSLHFPVFRIVFWGIAFRWNLFEVWSFNNQGMHNSVVCLTHFVPQMRISRFDHDVTSTRKWETIVLIDLSMIKFTCQHHVSGYVCCVWHLGWFLFTFWLKQFLLQNFWSSYTFFILKHEKQTLCYIHTKFEGDKHNNFLSPIYFVGASVSAPTTASLA